MSNTRNQKRNFFGGVLIALGTILLLNNLQLIPWIPHFLYSWKMVMIVLGSYLLYTGKTFKGLALMGLGTYFLIPEVLNIEIQPFHLVWPAILIFLGLKFIFDKKGEPWTRKFEKMDTSEADMLNISVFMSGETRTISSYDFKGGNVSAFMGGAELDLTNCTLAEGGAEIRLNIVMGGLELTIPREWNIRSEVTPILGGIEDQAFKSPDLYIDPAALVVLTGRVVMGGIEIKRI